MEEEENKTMGERLKEIERAVVVSKNGKKSKGFKLPFKAKIGNTKLKKGYVTIQVIHENGAVDFDKREIIDGTIKLHDTYHAIDSSDVLSYKGKPFIIQPKKSKNPLNPNNMQNNTYGQKQIMSRMMNEALKIGGKVAGVGISIGALIIGGIIIYALIAG